MRVGFDLSKAHHPDGIGTWQRQVSRALAAELKADGSAVSLAALSLTAPWRESSREEIRDALGEPAEAFDWTERVGHECDVIVSSAWAVPNNFEGRLIFVVHDLTFHTHPECHTRLNRLHCLEGLLRTALTTEHHFVAVSQATANTLTEILPAAGANLSVIRNGVSDFWQQIGDESVADIVTSRFQLTPAGYVLSVGSLEPRKNLERLLSAHQTLPIDERRRFPLVLAGGQGWKNSTLREQLEQDPHVRRLGRVTDEELRALYNGSALFVYPSLAEGFGLPVAEALACGAPVLCSNTTSLPEVAGKAAEMVDPEDLDAVSSALENLLSDPDRRRRLAKQGPAQAAHFTWPAAAHQLLDLLRVGTDPS